MYIPAVLLAGLASAVAVMAHQQPTTFVMMEAQAEGVAMSLHVPLSELELAFGHDVNRYPAGPALTGWDEDFRRYLLAHIQPYTSTGARWTIEVREMRLADAGQPQSGPFREVFASLWLTPPAGASARSFTLRYDLILHQVVTHKAMVSLETDWSGGRLRPSRVGVIAVDQSTGRIEPLAVDLGGGHWWTGFSAMIRLGGEHIREGTDHLLFLLVLLLPATLSVRNGRWAEYGGARYALFRLVKIVTAFTLGHSLTLLAGGLHWLTLPQQPVELLIAASILVTAVHAIRPLFPGWEARVAAGFGLVHGLAFASALSDLKLTAGPLMLSILGFNLGIELTQLFVVLMTMPWLLLLSPTVMHRWVRIGGAALAGVAAAGWMLNRATGASNAVEQVMAQATEVAPLGILVLAGIALPAYLLRSCRKAEELSHERKLQSEG